MGCLRGIEAERLALAQGQQPGDRIDFAIGENDALYRGRAQTGLCLQFRGCENLRPQIGRGIEYKPVMAIAADSQRGLATGRDLACAGSAAGRSVGIPLGKAAASAAAENDDIEHGRGQSVRHRPETTTAARGVRLLCVSEPMKNLLLLAADIGVDFGAERNFGNLRGIPGHDDILFENHSRVLRQLYDTTRKWVASQRDSTQ